MFAAMQNVNNLKSSKDNFAVLFALPCPAACLIPVLTMPTLTDIFSLSTAKIKTLLKIYLFLGKYHPKHYVFSGFCLCQFSSFWAEAARARQNTASTA
jgi:hypothetical protein